jgi:hypothetical protein
LGLSEAELWRSSSPTTAGKPHDPAAATPAEDRLELVRSQNLDSLHPEPEDMQQARELLGQVGRLLGGMGKAALREVYQFDRLRELCCRLQESNGV